MSKVYAVIAKAPESHYDSTSHLSVVGGRDGACITQDGGYAGARQVVKVWTPDAARVIGAALLDWANELDPKGGI